MEQFTKKQLISKIILKYIDDELRPNRRQHLNNFNKDQLVAIFEKQEKNKTKERNERFKQIKPLLYKQDLIALDPNSEEFIRKLQIKCELFNTLCAFQMFIKQLYKRYYKGTGLVLVYNHYLHHELPLKQYQAHAHIGVKYAYDTICDDRFPVYYAQLKGLFHPNWKFVPYIDWNDNAEIIRFFSALRKLKSKIDS